MKKYRACVKSMTLHNVPTDYIKDARNNIKITEQITFTNKINSVARPNCILKLVNTFNMTFQIHISTIIPKTDQTTGLLEGFAEDRVWKQWSV